MAVTPYLRKFNTSGGTLYVFPSVSKDLTKTFVSNDYEFKFSHFACLNIPNVHLGVYSEDSDSDDTNDLPRGLYLRTLYETNDVNFNTDPNYYNDALVENLQNYVMNFETAILSREDYDTDVLSTVSEKIFFNWLSKVGAIKFSDVESIEKYDELSDRTVQYIGNIDVMNTVEIGGDSYEELYIHIPSTVGASTKVYFRTNEYNDDKNYPTNTSYVVSGNTENIIGRNEDNTHPDELSIKAFFDDDTTNSYEGDSGYTIDFRDSSYSDGISNMNSKSLEDFEFNAILIYYDIFEKTKTPGVKKTATNLYGILFLDQIKTNENESGIQRLPKVKGTVTGNGTSYALKLDLKVDTGYDAQSAIIEVNDPNSVISMNLYVNALKQLQKCIDLFYTQKTEMTKLSERISTLENMVMDIDSVSSIKDELKQLKDEFNDRVNTKTLTDLIEVNSKKINSIMNGEKNLKLQYDTDVIQPGSGISIEKQNKNKIVINSECSYSIACVYDIDGNEVNKISATDLKEYYIELKKGNNFAVFDIESNGNGGDFKNNLIIFIRNDFKVGQSLKMYFNGSLNFENNDCGINIQIGDTQLTITKTEFEGNNLIEIICVGEGDFIYLIK